MFCSAAYSRSLACIPSTKTSREDNNAAKVRSYAATKTDIYRVENILTFSVMLFLFYFYFFI